jgi:predicted SnoaL-like aldol condensation-catalyzing enzyme
MSIIKINYDALKKDSWSEQEAKNVKLVIDFIQNLMNKHDFDYIKKVFGNHPYVQHNRTIPDGIEGLLGYIGGFVKRFPEYTYDVKHIYADGDFVIFQSQATVSAKHRGNDNKGFNIFDTWKIENGKIGDHWDALQPMDGMMRFINLLNGGSIKNSNGVY